MNQGIIKVTGGARVGWMNASFPLAKLVVELDRLALKVALMGTYTFKRGEIISLEKTGFLPYLGWGMKITHNRNDYPKRIIFWTFSNPEKLIKRISRSGFMTGSWVEQRETAPEPAREGFPVKAFPVATVIILWNVLFLLDFMAGAGDVQQWPGVFTLTALFGVFVLTVSLRLFKKVRGIILKEGRSFDEIKHINNLIMLVTGFMLFVLANIRFINVY